MKKLAVVLAAGILLLAGCSQATEDRVGGNGSSPDETVDATRVVVFRNADSVPNLAMFCADGLRFASTLSGGDDGANKASTVIRLPERDSVC